MIKWYDISFATLYVEQHKICIHNVSVYSTVHSYENPLKVIFGRGDRVKYYNLVATTLGPDVEASVKLHAAAALTPEVDHRVPLGYWWAQKTVWTSQRKITLPLPKGSAHGSSYAQPQPNRNTD